ncbi:MAG TPA: ATP-binding protein [Myxococcaceae bacterium]|nr:ATP-binding protein [Myxococcaceae bacterium]
MRRKDWGSTPLGDAGRWPQSLRTSVSICLNSRMPVLVWWGRDLVMLYNDAYRQLIGAKHPAALGQPGRECWPEIWHVIGPMLDAVLSRGESTFSEDLMLPLERKGFPEECYFTFSYSPIREEAGTIGGVFCSVVETTAQVLAARRTRTLRRLAEIASVGRTESDALALSMEILRDGAADVPWALYRPPRDDKAEPPVSVGLERPEVEVPAPVLDASAGPASGQEVVAPRGWVLPIGKSGSRPGGLLALGRSPMLAFDESYRTFFELVAAAVGSSLETARAFEEEKRRAESWEVIRRLERQHAQHLASVFDNAPVAIAMLRGPDLVYDFANPSYRALVAGRDVVGKPLLSALPELQGQGILELLQGVLRAGKPFTHQGLRVQLQRRPGAELEEVFFNLVYEPLKDERGEVHAIAVVATDVTDLVRARQEAEEANRAKDEFMAMLGHELRNPLSPMLTTLELMRLRAPDVLERERGILERQVQHLARLVDDLLDVSRIARGVVELEREVVELSSVVAVAVEQVSPMLEERGHYLRLSVHRTGLRVMADPGRLAQVVFNLLHNAAKYTDPGGHLNIIARREGHEIALSVRDDGIGIAPDLQPRVFETFFQARQERDRAKGGLGLGLALVKSLTELHGGRVEVESPGVGMGSTFTVRLPLAIESTASEEVHVQGEQAMPSVPDRGLRILVVDDNVDAAESIAEVLELLGNQVRVAHDSLEALRLARESEPDLALLDIGLPVIDGYELAQRLRSEHPSVRLVAVSGYGQDADRTAALEAGFSRHLVKPVSLEEIESVVDGDSGSAPEEGKPWERRS